MDLVDKTISPDTMLVKSQVHHCGCCKLVSVIYLYKDNDGIMWNNVVVLCSDASCRKRLQRLLQYYCSTTAGVEEDAAASTPMD